MDVNKELCSHTVVVDPMFIVAPIVCGSFVFGPCFIMQHFVSFLVLPSSPQGRENRPQGNKTFSMLNSAEHKIYPAHKC